VHADNRRLEATGPDGGYAWRDCAPTACRQKGEAITALKGLLQRMMEHQSKKTARLRALRSWQ
jgi:hypothetical protein